MDMIEKPSLAAKVRIICLGLFPPLIFSLNIIALEETKAKIVDSLTFLAAIAYSIFVILPLYNIKLKITRDTVEITKLFKHISIKWDEIAECKIIASRTVQIKANNGAIISVEKSDYKNFAEIVSRIKEKLEIKNERCWTPDHRFHIFFLFLLTMYCVSMFFLPWSKLVFAGWLCGIVWGFIINIRKLWFRKEMESQQGRHDTIISFLEIFTVPIVISIIALILDPKMPFIWISISIPSFFLGMIPSFIIFLYVKMFLSNEKAKETSSS